MRPNTRAFFLRRQRVQSQVIDAHFSRISQIYRGFRTTDIEPIRYIRDALSTCVAPRGADIGCGAGRYDLLLFRHIPTLYLICADRNAEMLMELDRYLKAQGIIAFETMVSSFDELQLEDSSLDCVFAFNAIHHFDFSTFLSVAGRALRKRGQLFIYTRTPEQNSGSIWGQCFPDFCERETRLFELDDMKQWIGDSHGLRLVNAKTFRYERMASLERLLAQAREKHYSTFCLYGKKEFQIACHSFAENVRARFKDTGNIVWYDENILLHITR